MRQSVFTTQSFLITHPYKLAMIGYTDSYKNSLAPKGLDMSQNQMMYSIECIKM